MKKYLAYLLLFAFICTACGSSSNTPVSTAKDGNQQTPTLISSTKETKTPSPKPTTTALPPTVTETVVPPTEVRMKMMRRSDFENFTWETSWGPTMSEEEFKNLDNILPVQDIKFDNSTVPLSINQVPKNQGVVVEVRALFGKNLFMLRPAAVELNNGITYHAFVCLGVVKGSDGNNKLVRLNLSFDVSDPIYIKQYENYIRTLLSTDGILTNVIIREDDGLAFGVDYFTPLIGHDPIRDDFYNGIVDDRIGDVLLWIGNTTGFNVTK